MNLMRENENVIEKKLDEILISLTNEERVRLAEKLNSKGNA